MPLTNRRHRAAVVIFRGGCAAARLLSSIEINGSFYSLQRPKPCAEWRAQRGARLRGYRACFDNDARKHAPFDALRLSRLLGVVEQDQPYEEAIARRPKDREGAR